MTTHRASIVKILGNLLDRASPLLPAAVISKPNGVGTVTLAMDIARLAGFIVEDVRTPLIAMCALSDGGHLHARIGELAAGDKPFLILIDEDAGRDIVSCLSWLAKTKMGPRAVGAIIGITSGSAEDMGRHMAEGLGISIMDMERLTIKALPAG